MDIAVFSIILLLMTVGLLGVILPVVPGVSFMFLATLAYYFGDGSRLSFEELATLGMIALLAILVEFSAGFFDDKMKGPAGRSILYGAIGLGPGVWFFQPYGGFIGIFLGLTIAELFTKRVEITGITPLPTMVPKTSGKALNFVIALVFVIVLSVNFWNEI